MTRQIRIKKGLDVPLTGQPVQQISDGPAIRHVALVGDDYVGMKPTMAVAEGDQVRLGQVLFTHKRLPEIRFTAPAAGRVLAVNRGPKRKFESLVIEVEGDERVEFRSFADTNPGSVSAADVRQHLLETGLWPALRTRPFSGVANPETVPFALFVTAIDTRPLAADPRVVIAGQDADFVAGLQVVSKLTDGRTYLCRAPGAPLPGEDLSEIETVEFAGPHPAGLPGTHIHFLAPVDMERSVWHINYQDVIAIGHLFRTGEISNDRIVAIAGPAASNPRLVRTQLGASLNELTAGEAKSGLDQPLRVISGSILGGRTSTAPIDFLGRYHLAVSLIEEGSRRNFLGWMGPGANKFSIKPIFLSALSAGKRFAMTTSTEGSHRAIVPIGSYEAVMPLDILPTALLKALVMDDTETAQALGCLELDEEDLSLCTFVDPGKHEFGPFLRRNLTRIEIEG